MDKVEKNVMKIVKENPPFLPDEIITNILVRLPVKSLVRFELVCRKWRDIIFSRDFVDLHHRSTMPLIIRRIDFNKDHLKLFTVDKWWDPNLFAVDNCWDRSRLRSMILRFPFVAADFPMKCFEPFSHAGFIVLRSVFINPMIVIVNPARPSHEFVKINFSTEYPGDICAVYYHSSLKEYCLLWKMFNSGPNQINLFEYKLLVLSSKPYLRRIRNPFNYRVKDEYAYPLFINDHLYWMLKSELHEDKYGGRNDILEFDIISEEFKVIPCPVPLNAECKEHQTDLLNNDGVISFVWILPSTITIWRLEDRLQQLWTAIEYKIYRDVDAIGLIDGIGIIAVVDGKLAFESGQRLFVCNLMDGTVENNPRQSADSLMSYQMTSASLKNCKCELYIDKDGNLMV